MDMAIRYRAIVATEPTQHALATTNDSIYTLPTYALAFARMKLVVTARYLHLQPLISEMNGEAKDNNGLLLGWIERWGTE